MDYPESTSQNSYKKRQEKMLKRLKTLPKNPIVAAAIKRKKGELGEDENREQWNAVDELVSAARKQCMEGEDFDSTIKDLSSALLALAGEEGAGEDETKDD